MTASSKQEKLEPDGEAALISAEDDSQISPSQNNLSRSILLPYVKLVRAKAKGKKVV